MGEAVSPVHRAGPGAPSRKRRGDPVPIGGWEAPEEGAGDPEAPAEAREGWGGLPTTEQPGWQRVKPSEELAKGRRGSRLRSSQTDTCAPWAAWSVASPPCSPWEGVQEGCVPLWLQRGERVARARVGVGVAV